MLPLPKCNLSACPVHGNPNLLDYDWIRRNAQLIHYFGLGFIQVKLSADVRMHFYTDRIDPTVTEEEIHNHRYDFRSDVIRGMLQHKLYSCRYLPEVFEGTHWLGEVSCDPKKPGRSTGIPVVLTLACQTRMSAGSHYTLDKDTFHRVESKNAITFLHTVPREREFANVARPIGSSPAVCPFSKQVPEVDLWKIVRGMML